VSRLVPQFEISETSSAQMDRVLTRLNLPQLRPALEMAYWAGRIDGLVAAMENDRETDT